jgi:hypothetical protein
VADSARDIFVAFLERSAGRRLVIACPADAAGLAAGEMARRWLAARGYESPQILTPPRGQLLTGKRLAEAARSAGAEALLALDLGAGDDALPSGAVALFIDLHRHAANLAAPVIEPTNEPKPAGVVLFEIIHELAVGAMSAAVCRHANEDMAADDGRPGTHHSEGDKALAWLAAMAAEAGHPRVELSADLVPSKLFHKSALREAAVLLNSAARSSDYPVAAALALLSRAAGPPELLAEESADARALLDARAEVLREVGHWSRTRPRFMWRVALVPVASPCRIEDILAAMWERQLPTYMVVVANSGYVAGRVTVVARTASQDRDLLRLLDAVTPKELAEPLALGRRDYIEAIMPVEVWKAMLTKMRFRNPRNLVPPPQEANLF